MCQNAAGDVPGDLRSSSANSSKNDSNTCAEKSSENDSESTHNETLNLTQTSDKQPTDHIEVTRSTPSSSRELDSINREENIDKVSAELQEISEFKKESVEEKNSDNVKKKIKQIIKADEFSKFTQEVAKSIKNVTVITAYPAKHKPKQPFMPNQPDPQGIRSRPPPKLPAPPSYYTPPAQRRPEPPKEQAPPRQVPQQTQPETAASTAHSHPPVSPAGGAQVNLPIYTRGPAMPLFLDPFPFYYEYPFFWPSALYSTVVWAQFPVKIPPHAPGYLAHLLVADSLFVVKFSAYDYYVDWGDYFLIQNRNGECLYVVYESMDYNYLACCRTYQNLYVLDMYQNEVFFLHRVSEGSTCFGCHKEIRVYGLPETLMGAITRKYKFCRDEYNLLDSDGNQVFKMTGPKCGSACCVTVGTEYKILALDVNSTEIGQIRLESANESYFTTECFGVYFPLDMDVKMKALFLGAVFIITG